MARILRSISRRKRLQVQHILQINGILRGKISNRTETNIDDLKQGEFLSLFGLIPVPIQSKSIKKRKQSDRNPIKEPPKKRNLRQNGDASKNAPKIYGKLHGCICTQSSICFGFSGICGIILSDFVMSFDYFSDFCTEKYIATEQHVQRILLAKKESILNAMRDAIADKRNSETLYEQDKQMKILLKVKINELHKKMIFICNMNADSVAPHNLKNNR